MKIYTKTGDQGETSLFGGARLSKAHIRIHSYGSVDELNSYVGLVRDLIPQDNIRIILKMVQETLFSIGSHLAADPSRENSWLPKLSEERIHDLEKSIDDMNDELPALKNFILPGGHPMVSHCHIARCVCRRSERHVVALNDIEPVNAIIIRYLNRLSDFLFVLARYIGYTNEVEEVIWEGR